jgi:hypothetical protein
MQKEGEVVPNVFSKSKCDNSLGEDPAKSNVNPFMSSPRERGAPLLHLNVEKYETKGWGGPHPLGAPLDQRDKVQMLKGGSHLP